MPEAADDSSGCVEDVAKMGGEDVVPDGIEESTPLFSPVTAVAEAWTSL